jgi:hypothetical protein
MLGDLSKKYESSGDPGAISSGYQDPGGKSYGAYQLSSNAGSVGSFLHWAINLSGNDVYQHYGTALADYEIRSSGFDAKWREIAAVDGAGFFRMQHDYICYAYYFPAVDALRAAGFDPDKHTRVMQDVVWSRAVQYGTGNIVEMFMTAVQRMYNEARDDYSGYPNLSYVDDAKFDYDLIRAVYQSVCKTPEWTAASCRYGLYRRFDAECADALTMLESGEG